MPPNPHLTRAIVGMAGLQAVVSLVPAARRLLGTTPLNIGDLLVIAAGVLLPLVVNEGTKPAAPVETEEEDDLQAEYSTDAVEDDTEKEEAR